MTIRIKPLQVLVGIVAGALLAGGGYAIAASRSAVIHGCVSKKTRALSVSARCGEGTTVLTWNRQGRAGAKGAKGVRGASGAPATVSVGSVSTGAPGSQVSVTNVGTASKATLDFTIPQGEPGSNGINTGPDAYGQVWMGSSTAGLAPGNNENITSVASGGVGTADVQVQGCSSAGLTEPVITVTADHDDADGLDGRNNSTNTAVAWVAHWSTVPDTSLLAIEVQTNDPTGGAPVDSDFSIKVIC